MRTKRWVRSVCFLLLLLLTMQPLCTGTALAATEEEGRAFVDAVYTFTGASGNVPLETVLQATPGAIETAKALKAITPTDALKVEVAFSGENEEVVAVLGESLGVVGGMMDEELRTFMGELQQYATREEYLAAFLKEFENSIREYYIGKNLDPLSKDSDKRFTTVPIAEITEILQDAAAKMKTLVSYTVTYPNGATDFTMVDLPPHF